MIKTILELNSEEARKEFLKSRNYFTTDLPEYFDFSGILLEVSSQLRKKDGSHGRLHDILPDKGAYKEIKSLPDINGELILSKDGEYDWRGLKLINPYLYVDLVNCLTEKDNWKKLKERFKKFESEKIICTSLPVFSSGDNKKDKFKPGLNWWENFEQEVIKEALKYRYCVRTDLTNCYSSIYTHTIAWAIEGKDIAKENRSIELLGNEIDICIQRMQSGQTNGIPQGSVVFDLIAELILGYADLLLYKVLEKKLQNDYKIIRYRDDYCILAKNKSDADIIIQELADVTQKLNLHINNKKTRYGSDIVGLSLKEDKLYWIDKESEIRNDTKSLQKRLLVIYKLTKKFPNSGSVGNALRSYRKVLLKLRAKTLSKIELKAIILNLLSEHSGICEELKDFIGYKNSNIKSKDINKLVQNKVRNLRDVDYLLSIFNNTVGKLNNEVVRNKVLKEIYGIKCRISMSQRRLESYPQLISILYAIAEKSPKYINIVVSCIGLIQDCLLGKELESFNKYASEMIQHFKERPNSEYMMIWMQRLFLNSQVNVAEYGNFGKVVSDELKGKKQTNLWNMEWLTSNLGITNAVVNKEKINNISQIIAVDNSEKY